jgi:hypothetical protein
VGQLGVRTGSDRVLDYLERAGPDCRPDYGPDWTGSGFRQFEPAEPDCGPACGPDRTVF